MKQFINLLRLVLTAGIILYFFPFESSKAVAASTYAVNDSGDASDATPGNNICATAGGKCTLRAAIEEANAHNGPDEITIPAMTIVLTKQLATNSKYVGNAFQDTSVTIRGAGQSATIIDGNFTTRAFYFDPRSGTHRIEDLTIQNAYILNKTINDPRNMKNGGGIFNEANLTVKNVTVKNCRAYQGGGIYGEHAFQGTLGWNIPSLTLLNVTLSGNTATSPDYGYAGGGGLFSGSLLSADGLVVTNNYALQGGGVYHNSLSSLNQVSTIRNFTISGNAAVDGAGVDNDEGNLNLTNGSIDHNAASGCRPPPYAECTYTGGGGIFNNNGAMTLIQVDVLANSIGTAGGYGGGIFNYKTMSIFRSSIRENKSATGAGIFNGNYDGAANSLILENTTIANNQGVDSGGIQSQGGGIYNNGAINSMNNTIAYNQASYGGGIDNFSGNATIVNTLIAKNIGTVNSPDCRDTITSSGYNLVGSTSGCSFNAQSSDKVNVDSKLFSYQVSLFYIPILPGSPSIDAGTKQNCPTLDQPGNSRPIGSSCEIGAFEYTPLNLNYHNFIPAIRK